MPQGSLSLCYSAVSGDMLTRRTGALWSRAFAGLEDFQRRFSHSAREDSLTEGSQSMSLSLLQVPSLLKLPDRTPTQVLT